MALVINTNTAASSASAVLGSTTSNLQKSLARLSSGSKITEPADDAGGLAVAMKMQAAIRRNAAVNNNVANTMSFLQTQDGALKTIGDVLNRLSELKMLYGDPTKNTSDKANYETEFNQLVLQLNNLKAEKFNGVSVFKATSIGTVAITEDGGQSVSLSACDVGSTLTSITSTAIASLSISTVTNAIAGVASLRATNGAQSSRLQFASNMLVINKTNLEAANSRIVDTDVAVESTAFAKYQILAQSGTAMLAQANTLPQVALKLLG